MTAATAAAALPSALAAALAERRVLVLDGGLATQLEEEGHRLEDDLWSARLLLDDPGAIAGAHEAYFCAGADVGITSSYQASVGGFQKPSVGCYGATLSNGAEYSGDYGPGMDAGDLEAWHWPRIRVLAESRPDCFACETLPRVDEAVALCRCLARLARRGGGLPSSAWVSFCCRDEELLAGGEPFVEGVRVASASPHVLAVGVNCTDARHVPALLALARTVTDKPLVAYPNRGERWDAAAKAWVDGSGVGDEAFAALAAAWIEGGARIVGGCCRVGPPAIRAIRAAADAANAAVAGGHPR